VQFARFILAKASVRTRGRNAEIFINCPFDDAYAPCFEALLFTVTIAGYRARCALEENDAGEIRFDKLRRLIADCDFTIHDLSRIQLGDNNLPRFNMPFELGLMMGAKYFGGPKQRAKQACILVANDFVLPTYLSDLAGNDPAAHNDDPRQVIKIVRDHLHNDPAGKRLPGVLHIAKLFDDFSANLPVLARQAQLTVEEVHARRGYNNFMDLLLGYCSALPDVGKRLT